MDMEPKIIEIKTTPSESERKREPGRLSVMAGPTVWYLLAGVSIILSLYLFLLAHGGDVAARHEMALFVGLWAPMFGILGLRAEILELRDDLRMKGRK